MANRTIRILQVITSLAGGAAYQVWQLAKHLDRDRFEVGVAFGPGYPLDETIAAEGIRHYPLAWTRRLSPLSTVKGANQLSAILARTPVDIVHAHCSLAGVVGRTVAKLHRVPTVLFTFHAFASRDYQPLWRKRLYLEVERAMDRFTDHYFVYTKAYRDEMVARRITTPDRVSVIPLGIEVDPPPTQAQRLDARAAFGLDERDFAILAAGRLELQKGIEYLIRALPAILARCPSASVMVAGDGPLRPSLMALAERLGVTGRVRFLGWRQDLETVMAAADLYCLPSLWESGGYVVLEAMASSLPLVVTDVVGVSEVVEGGRVAELVPPADHTALAEAIVSLLEDPARRSELARLGRSKLESDYQLSDMIRGYEAAYASLAGRRDDCFKAA